MDSVPPALDAEVLRGLRSLDEGGAKEILIQVIDLFLQRGVELVAEMREAFALRDAERLSRAAHALRGSAGCLGAKPLSARCASLEEEARAAIEAVPASLIDAIEAEFGRARAALEAERGR